MTKLIDTREKWEEAKNLAHETPKYKARTDERFTTDELLLLNHYQQEEEVHAQDWDTWENERLHQVKKNNNLKVSEAEQKQEEILNNWLNPLERIRQRIIKELNEQINPTEIEVIKKEEPAPQIVKEFIKCDCNIKELERSLNDFHKSLETKIGELKEAIVSIPQIDYNPIFNKIDTIKTAPTITNFPTINEIKEIITNNNKELINNLPKVEPTKEIKEEPKKKVESAEDFQKAILSEQEARELNVLKIEVGKLKLNTTEENLLNRADTKEKVQLLEKAIKERLEKEESDRKLKAEQEEKERKENERLAKEKTELEKKEREKREKEAELVKEKTTADKIFNDDKSIVKQYQRAVFFSNSLKDLKDSLGTGLFWTFVLHKLKNGKWGIVFINSVSSGKFVDWLSPSNLTEQEREWQEVMNELEPLKLGLIRNSSGEKGYDMNKENSIKYSLMWSLSYIRQQRRENANWNWIKNENNWKLQMEKEFAEAEKL
jgi:hypothetical protein